MLYVLCRCDGKCTTIQHFCFGPFFTQTFFQFALFKDCGTDESVAFEGWEVERLKVYVCILLLKNIVTVDIFLSPHPLLMLLHTSVLADVTNRSTMSINKHEWLSWSRVWIFFANQRWWFKKNEMPKSKCWHPSIYGQVYWVDEVDMTSRLYIGLLQKAPHLLKVLSDLCVSAW